MIIFVILNVYLSYQIFGLPVSTFKAGYRYMEDCSAYVSVDGWDAIGMKVQRFRVVQQASVLLETTEPVNGDTCGKD